MRGFMRIVQSLLASPLDSNWCIGVEELTSLDSAENTREI